LPSYDVEVTVNFMYEVEADSREEAEQEGWNWEEYPMFGEVYSIDVTEITHYPEDSGVEDDA